MIQDLAVDISVVVCTRNRAESLRETLCSLVAQQSDGQFAYEVLVVDNASTDHTPRVVEEISAAARIPVRYVREQCRGTSYARNRGVATARGEWIASFDDDQVADTRWLSQLFLLAKQKNVRSVGGAVLLRLPEGFDREVSPVCRRVLGESSGWDQPRRYTRSEGPGAGNQMLHRSVYESVGVYDVAYNLRGEDVDLYRRIRAAGIDTWYTPHAIAWHLSLIHI